MRFDYFEDIIILKFIIFTIITLITIMSVTYVLSIKWTNDEDYQFENSEDQAIFRR